MNILLRFGGAAKGMLWASQVATGAGQRAASLRVYGDKGGIEWAQETPGDACSSRRWASRRASIGAAGPAFRRRRNPRHAARRADIRRDISKAAQIYADAAELMSAHSEKREPDAFAKLAPGVADGVRGVKFIEAAIHIAAETTARGRRSEELEMRIADLVLRFATLMLPPATASRGGRPPAPAEAPAPAPAPPAMNTLTAEEQARLEAAVQRQPTSPDGRATRRMRQATAWRVQDGTIALTAR